MANKTSDEASMTFKIGDFGLVAKIGEENRVYLPCKSGFSRDSKMFLFYF
jgi:hypothetical protein